MDQPVNDPAPTRVVEEPLRRIGRPDHKGRGTIESVKEIFAYRELLGRLVSREIRAKYKNSSLGIVWSLVRPLAQLLIYYVAIGQFLGAAGNTPDFAIFIFTGLTIWGLYSEIISVGTTSIVSNGGLVKKVYLPREIFPLAAVGGALFNFTVQFGILVVATFVALKPPLHWELLYLPLVIALVVVLGTAVSLVLSAVNVYLRDVQHLVEVMLLIFFWASPIVYSISFVNATLHGSLLEEIYLANPVTLAVLGMQKAMWVAGTSDPSQYWPPNLEIRLVVALVVSVFLLWIAQRVFSRLQSNFAQEL
jgi:ABC-2 type transport system permease protein